jgi:hypothetical protein
LGAKLWGFGVLAIVVLLGAVVLTALRFIKPLDKIELGVAEIINGNIDYQFRPVGPDFEGLSNGLNVMLARLLGREEPERRRARRRSRTRPARWRSDQMLVEEVAGPSATPRPEATRWAGERADLYYARILQRIRRGAAQPGKPTKGSRCRRSRQAAADRRRPQAEVEVPAWCASRSPRRARQSRCGDPTQLDRRRTERSTCRGDNVVLVPVATGDSTSLHRTAWIWRGAPGGAALPSGSVTSSWSTRRRLIAAGVVPCGCSGPEHGVRGEAQDMVGVDDDRDTRTGIPVTSLYGVSFDSLTPAPATWTASIC